MSIAAHVRYAVGLDLGGTDLKAARILADGGIEAFTRLPSRAAESAEAPLEVIAQAVEELTRDRRQAAVGAGLGAPGVIHPESGSLLGPTPHLHHWSAFPLRIRAASRVGLPLVVDNDANLAALAEHRLGAARGARVSMTVTVGTGIGAGIIVDGRIYRGAWGGAGEIGHMALGRAGAACRCGVPGCVEPEASGGGLARMGRESGLAASGAGAVFAAAAAGDVRGRAALETMTDRLGAAIGAAVSLINPEVVVIGGGVALAGEALMVPLRAAIERYTQAPHRDGLRVLAASLGERAGVVGAGLLAWDRVTAAAEKM